MIEVTVGAVFGFPHMMPAVVAVETHCTEIDKQYARYDVLSIETIDNEDVYTIKARLSFDEDNDMDYEFVDVYLDDD
jgi:hypothetical protein